MVRTYVFAFTPEPEGGFTVTCPALPGLVTHGEDMARAKAMARDAMEGMIEVMIEHGETLPESDLPHTASRFGELARTLLDEVQAEPIFEVLSARVAEPV
jgi:antitoxin HicB